MADGKKEKSTVTLKIDGVEVTVRPGTMILEAAARAGVRIPTLCHNQRLTPYGACRICVVQQKGRRGLTPACFNPVRNGMEILTHTPEVMKARRIQLQLLLIAHPLECPVCDAGGQCQLQDLVYEYGVAANPYKGKKANIPVDHVSPFIERNLNRCVLCGMCVRICDEVVGANELQFAHRGIQTKVSTDYDRPMNCEFCGQCVSVCPVGALNDRIFLHKGRVWDLKETPTPCGYCGVGCTLTVGQRGNRILRVRAEEDRGNNHGNLCVKGRFGWEYIHHPERLTTPLIKKNGAFGKATWEEALRLVAQRFQEIQKQKGGGSLAGLCSPRLTNEELYLFQKFMRGVLGTNHIDHDGGYGYAGHLALREALGYGASTNSMNEVRRAEVILALRSDTSETHPVMKSEVVLAVKRRKAKLIVVNSRDIYLNKFSSLNLLVKPGTEVVLLNGMINIILKEGLAREEFIQARTEGIGSLKNHINPYTAEKVEALTGIPAASLAEGARLFAKAAKAVILISTGLASGKEDAALTKAAANLALLTGQVGREGAGIFLMGEKNNSQGALDMGVSPGLLPGYGDIQNPEERAHFEKAWEMALPAEPGMKALNILKAAEEGKVRGLYIAGENPAVSYPDSRRIKKILAQVEFLVVQDFFMTETAAAAQVVLPAVPFAEKEGTFTNLERRVQRVRKTLVPPGEAKPDLWIFQEVAKAMGKNLGNQSPGSVMDEIRSLVPLYQAMDYARLEGPTGLQWPCPDLKNPGDGPENPRGTPFLLAKDFAGGKGKFRPVDFEPDPPDPEYPWVLITGPTLFHSGSLSTMDPGLLKIAGESYVEIHPADARELGLAEKQKVTLKSKRGQIIVPVHISRRAAKGVLFMPFHFKTQGVNQLAGWDLGTLRVQLEKI